MSHSPRYTLALDIATSLGWALAEDARIVKSGVVDFSLSKHESEGKRLARFYNFLQEFVSNGVHEVFYERVYGFKGRDTTLFNEFHGILKLIVDNTPGVRRFSVNPSSLKLQFAGSGKASKTQMCAVAHALGWQGGEEGTDRDHDECDAIAILVCILRERGYEATF